MWWGRLVLKRLKLPPHLFLALKQSSNLHLQPIYGILLGHQHIIQRLDGVILKSQTGFKIRHTSFKRHSTPSEIINASPRTAFNLLRKLSTSSRA